MQCLRLRMRTVTDESNEGCLWRRVKGMKEECSVCSEGFCAEE